MMDESKEAMVIEELVKLRKLADFAVVSDFLNLFAQAFRMHSFHSLKVDAETGSGRKKSGKTFTFSLVNSVEPHETLFDTHDLEKALTDPEESLFLIQLQVLLLRSLPNRKGITTDNWCEYLLKEYKKREMEKDLPLTEEGTFIYDRVHLIESKVAILRQLCEWQLEDPDFFSNFLFNYRGSGVEWRTEPIAYDSKNRAYYLLHDNRLYCESADGESWDTVCASTAEWLSFPEEFSSSRNRKDKDLYKLLVSELSPEVIPYFEEWDKKRERESYIRFRRRTGTDNRLCIKEIEREEEVKRKELLRIEQEAFMQERQSFRSSRRAPRVNYASLDSLDPSSGNAEAIEEDSGLSERERRIEARQRRLLELENKSLQDTLNISAAELVDQSAGEDVGKSLSEAEQPNTPITDQKRKYVKKRKPDQAPGSDVSSWLFQCLCGIKRKNFDDGTPMICCSECKRWMHVKCVNRSRNLPLTYNWDVVDSFLCQFCQPDYKKTFVIVFDLKKASRQEKRKQQQQQQQAEQQQQQIHNPTLGNGAFDGESSDVVAKAQEKSVHVVQRANPVLFQSQHQPLLYQHQKMQQMQHIQQMQFYQQQQQQQQRMMQMQIVNHGSNHHPQMFGSGLPHNVGINQLPQQSHNPMYDFQNQQQFRNNMMSINNSQRSTMFDLNQHQEQQQQLRNYQLPVGSSDPRPSLHATLTQEQQPSHLKSPSNHVVSLGASVGNTVRQTPQFPRTSPGASQFNPVPNSQGGDTNGSSINGLSMHVKDNVVTNNADAGLMVSRVDIKPVPVEPVSMNPVFSPKFPPQSPSQAPQQPSASASSIHNENDDNDYDF